MPYIVNNVVEWFENLGLGEDNGKNTFCELATGAMEPLRRTLTFFGKDFKQYVHERRCPWR